MIVSHPKTFLRSVTVYGPRRLKGRRQRWTLRASQRPSREKRGSPTLPYEDDGWDPVTPSYGIDARRPPRKYSEDVQLTGLSPFTNALIGGAFVLGVGAGVYFGTEVSSHFDIPSEGKRLGRGGTEQRGFYRNRGSSYAEF